jgi:hypothetical protein
MTEQDTFFKFGMKIMRLEIAPSWCILTTNMAAMAIHEAEQHQHRVVNSWFDYGPGGEVTRELFVACFSVCADK